MFEKFEIIECLKKDEHSGVYLANHIYLGKKIILKSLNTSGDPDPSIIERFKREAKILASLDHKNIIKVLDFGLHQNHLYISFEYFEGISLRTSISQKHICTDDYRNIIVQLIRGLNYAHNNHIIHRDIKPENIFLNDNCELKLGDFGLALSAKENLVTNQYSIVGTPSYMSPEQIKGEVLGKSSDLFSLGIVIFELITNKNPFLGKDINESINNIINFSFDSIEDNLKDIDEDIQNLLKGLLQKKPNERFQSCDEALEILNIAPEKVSLATNHHSDRKGLYKLVIPSVIVGLIILYLSFFGIQPEVEKPLITADSLETPQNQQNNDSITSLDTNIKSVAANNTSETVINDVTEKVESQNQRELENEVPEEKPGKVELGELFVECIPWADVYVDGNKIETTPLSKNIKMETGQHKIELIHPEFPEYSQNILIGADSITTLKINLNDFWGYLVCNLHPWGEIYLDGKLIGQTPLDKPIKLLPSNYKVKLTNPNFNALDTTILISASDTAIINYRFK